MFVNAVALVLLGLMFDGDEPKPSLMLVASFLDGITTPDVLEIAMNISEVMATGSSSVVGLSPGAGLDSIGPAPSLSELSIKLKHLGGGGATVASEGDLGSGDMREVGGKGDGSAAFFGVHANGKKFVFIVDASGSMTEDARFIRAMDQLEKSLRGLGTSQRYYVIFFSDQTYQQPTTGLVAATKENLARTMKWLEKLAPNGNTYPAFAVLRAYDLRPDAIFLLSDGVFGNDVLEYLHYTKLTKGSASLIPVHTIALGDRVGESMLRAISEITHGTFRFVR